MAADGEQRWYLDRRQELETLYLATDDPYRQSGWGSTAARWRLAREVILRAVDGSGTFCDVGCANGLLLENLREWATARGLTLEPFGVDFSAPLIELARRRLPQFAANFELANAWDWQPARRFAYVHTLLELVPESHHRQYLTRLMDNAVAAGGRLIVSNYGSRSKNLPALDVAGYLRALDFAVAGTAATTEDDLPLTRIAWLESNAQVAGARR